MTKGDPFAPGGVYSKQPLARPGVPYLGELCTICERPAVLALGCGPRCAAHQHHIGHSLAALRAERDRIDREIALRTGAP